jgi:hypothetical protein
MITIYMESCFRKLRHLVQFDVLIRFGFGLGLGLGIELELGIGLGSCHVLSCHVMSCHVLSCLVLSCLVLNCLVSACLVLPCLGLSCLVLSCHVLARLVLSSDCLVLESNLQVYTSIVDDDNPKWTIKAHQAQRISCLRVLRNLRV